EVRVRRGAAGADGRGREAVPGADRGGGAAAVGGRTAAAKATGRQRTQDDGRAARCIIRTGPPFRPPGGLLLGRSLRGLPLGRPALRLARLRIAVAGLGVRLSWLALCRVGLLGLGRRLRVAVAVELLRVGLSWLTLLRVRLSRKRLAGQ